MAVSVRTKLALVLTHVALSPVTAVALMSQQVGIPKQFFDLRDPDRNMNVAPSAMAWRTWGGLPAERSYRARVHGGVSDDAPGACGVVACGSAIGVACALYQLC